MEKRDPGQFLSLVLMVGRGHTGWPEGTVSRREQLPLRRKRVSDPVLGPVLPAGREGNSAEVLQGERRAWMVRGRASTTSEASRPAGPRSDVIVSAARPCR